MSIDNIPEIEILTADYAKSKPENWERLNLNQDLYFSGNLVLIKEKNHNKTFASVLNNKIARTHLQTFNIFKNRAKEIYNFEGDFEQKGGGIVYISSLSFNNKHYIHVEGNSRLYGKFDFEDIKNIFSRYIKNRCPHFNLEIG